MNDAISQMLLRTHSAWASNLLTDLPKHDSFKYKYALANTSEGFVDAYMQAFGEMLQNAQIVRPFDSDEFLVAAHEECLVLTSKCLYLVHNENKTVDAFLLCDIVNYQTSGQLKSKIHMELSDGRIVEYSSMDSAPVKPLIDRLIARQLSWSSTDEPDLRIEIPNPTSTMLQHISYHIVAPFFSIWIWFALVLTTDPPTRYVFIGLSLINLIYLLWGINHVRGGYAYRMILSDEGIKNGTVKYKWEDIELAKVFEEVSDKDEAGMSLYTHTGDEIRLVIPDKNGLPYSVMMAIKKYVSNIEHISKG